jgi:hypothetical protein
MHWPAPMTKDGQADKSVSTSLVLELLYPDSDCRSIGSIPGRKWNASIRSTPRSSRLLVRSCDFTPQLLTPFISTGVSNVSVKYFERLFASGITVTPAVNQVELHPQVPSMFLSLESSDEHFPVPAPSKTSLTIASPRALSSLHTPPWAPTILLTSPMRL